MHHIISDGWSLGVFVRELAALYAAFSAGLASPLQPLPIQYADYAHWQRTWVQGEVLQEHLTYWKKQLEGVPVLELPTDHPRPAIRSFRGSTHHFEFSNNVYASLQTLMKRHGVTLFMTCLAAFQAFLYRYTGQEDVVVGSPVANRNRTEVEGLIGFFVNTLVLRTNLSGNPNFREILSRAREITLGALAHQELPFEKVVEALQPDRDLSRDALFQVLFVVQNAAPTMEPREGLTIELLDSPTETAKFDLTLFIMEGEGTLAGALEYNTDLFEADSIRRMAENFTTFLAEAIADTERKLSEIPLLGSKERAGAWNATEKEFSRSACIHELIEQQTARTPDAIALVSGKGRLTYNELNRRANQLAHYLRVVGLGPQAIVGICMQRSIEMVISILGVLKAGAAYVPFDPAYPSERLAGMLEDAGVPVLLTEGRLIANLPPGNARLIGVDTDWEKIAQHPSQNAGFNVTPDHRVYAIFTSGSTGRPKLAAVYHRGFVNLMEWFVRAFAIGEQDRTLLVSSFNFDLTQKNIYAPLMTGGCLYLADPGVFDPVAMRRTIQDDRITLLNCTPSAFYPLVDQANDQTLEQLQSLREVFLGGEPISLQRMSGWTKSPSFHAEIVNTYGPTECTDICAFYRIKDPVNVAGPIPIGRPIYNVGLYVLDANLAPLPIGVPGELCVAGEGVGEGYINDAELTARKFLPNPFEGKDGERIYRTGDLVRYLPSGDIEYLGRIDHQIKIRGFRIELGEIESVLRQHPSVKEAVVLAREDTPGEKWLAGYVVPRESPAGSAAHVSDADLRRYLRSRLPDYMVPSAFAVLEALPLSPNGKLDRKALPIPDRTQRRSATAYAAPSTPQETALASILAELLGTESVGIHDNFFELGGDSILAIQLIARAGRAGLRLSPAQIFQHQTIAELAAVAGVPVDITAEQGVVEGPVPLTPVQQRYFAFTEVDPHHFNHAFLLEVRTPLDADVLKTAVSQILTHHDALRMRFECDGENWRQRNAGLDESPVDQVFVHRDLTGASESEQIRTVESESAELQGSLDLTHGPVMRVAYFDFGAGRANRLLMIIHHLVVDGVSWRVLMADLLMAYQQLQRQQPVTLAAKTTSFQHWAERLREYAKSEKLRQELDYWLSEKHAQLQPMPLDFAVRPNTAANLGTVISSLTPEETRALLQDVPAAFRTQINDALLTALVSAFAEWTGQTSLLIELEGHGRENLFEDVDISRTVGWFTSLYPVCLELTDSKNAGNALRSVRRQLDRIPNRGIGYGLLRYWSDDREARRKLQSHPMPEITFNYHGQVDQTFAEDMSIVGAKESYGAVQSPEQPRSQLLDIVSGVSDGELKVAWTYNCDLHLRSTIERLAESFSKQLRALIAASRDPGAVEYKPADFPMAKLNQDQLNKILKKVSKPK
jgi:amino acid adenylation domain-containing protein/non-ribosomal peptide synthase protein (TIGR01720 family)